MKYLKTFEDLDITDVQKKMISEIDCITHILDDEECHYAYNKNTPNFLAVSVMAPQHKGYPSLIGNPEIEEFEDRLKQICSDNGYECKRLLGAAPHNITWHMWDESKIDRTGWNYDSLNPTVGKRAGMKNKLNPLDLYESKEVQKDDRKERREKKEKLSKKGHCLARCNRQVIGTGNNRKIYCSGCDRVLKSL